MKEHKEHVLNEIQKYKTEQARIIQSIQDTSHDKMSHINDYKKTYQELEVKVNKLKFMLENTNATFKKYEQEIKHEMV